MITVPYLHRVLKRLWSQRQKEVRGAFKRTLPIGDYIVDRWEKARALGFGEGSSIYDNALVFDPVSVGENTWIGPFTILDGSGGGLIIGNNCTISAGVQIYTHDTIERTVSGGKVPIAKAPTRIGNCCYIGPSVVIAKGVTIGDHVVIGANSLVLSDIPSHKKAVGSPCRIIE